MRQHIKEAGTAAKVPQIHLGHANIQHADLYSPAWRDVHGEIYDLYSVVREHDFFENEEAIVL